MNSDLIHLHLKRQTLLCQLSVPDSSPTNPQCVPNHHSLESAIGVAYYVPGLVLRPYRLSYLSLDREATTVLCLDAEDEAYHERCFPISIAETSEELPTGSGIAGPTNWG